MTKASTDDNKIVALTSEITQLLHALVALEAIDDDRTYTSMDLLDTLDMTTQVVVERANDGIDDWRGDDKEKYSSFFDSVKEQVRITIQNYFVIPGKKSPRFVDPYNTLVLERLFALYKELGPSAMQSMAEPLALMFKTAVLDSIEGYPVQKQIDHARTTLALFRKAVVKPKALTKEHRLEMIATIVEKVREQIV